MNILKPQKMLFDNLRTIENLQSELIENDELENVKIKDYSTSNLEVFDATCNKAIFNNVSIINSRLEKTSFTDVEFSNCNFSNTTFDNCSFIRCEFNNCKLTGCNFIENVLFDIGFIDSNMGYANISMSNLRGLFFNNTSIRSGSLQENKVKNINFKEADLTGTQFFKTSLNGIDLSNSNIDQIAVSLEDIRDMAENFGGVEHRIEFVREINGAKWYNDSIASSPTRTIAGLNSFDEDIVLITGGYDKHLDYEPIAKPILNKVKTLILMGQTAEKIFGAVKQEKEKENKEIIQYCEDLNKELAKTIRKVGIVRYNAFKDTGSDLSFALALLNDNNDGVVLNGIYSREMSNIYAKPIKAGKSKYTISEQEQEAIDKAIESNGYNVIE